MQTTHPITYRYEVEGHVIDITRRHVHTAYARNGNVHNPTVYFVWDSTVDGAKTFIGERSRAVAYEYARAHALGIDYLNLPDHNVRRQKHKNVRPFNVVQSEMRSNYVGRVTEAKR